MNDNINWKQKLASRKFWALLAALGTSVLAAFGAGESTVVQVTGVIGAVGSVVAYVLAEAYVDSKRSGAEQGDAYEEKREDK
ncbi:phage holin family protein [Paenibacillus sp. ACRRX]|uniref:phage holin family protein n=1 Tax=Paenibacillus sp. ACRRX TaxID=2918206 RepID=UPI001EF478EF|nr:phage holin family protein [Paenibacillus sp. ACRRX]MCG7407676.1 phage holin family protein [Paenibacillus sp. ACRRX]